MVLYHFKSSEGSDFGPIDQQDFRQRYETGEINDETMVWRSGMVEWVTYSGLMAIEQRAAEPQAKQPVKRRKAAAAAKEPRPGFVACTSCHHEWPEALLFTEGTQRICGTCQNRQKEDLKNGRLKKSSNSTGAKAWALIVVAIVCAGCLAYKVSHYGIRLPKEKVQELTAPATYGK